MERLRWVELIEMKENQEDLVAYSLEKLDSILLELEKYGYYYYIIGVFDESEI